MSNKESWCEDSNEGRMEQGGCQSRKVVSESQRIQTKNPNKEFKQRIQSNAAMG